MSSVVAAPGREAVFHGGDDIGTHHSRRRTVTAASGACHGPWIAGDEGAAPDVSKLREERIEPAAQ